MLYFQSVTESWPVWGRYVIKLPIVAQIENYRIICSSTVISGEVRSRVNHDIGVINIKRNCIMITKIFFSAFGWTVTQVVNVQVVNLLTRLNIKIEVLTSKSPTTLYVLIEKQRHILRGIPYQFSWIFLCNKHVPLFNFNHSSFAHEEPKRSIKLRNFKTCTQYVFIQIEN